MSDAETIWIGSIDAILPDREALEAIGVTLGERVGDEWINCRVPDSALALMDDYWGIWYWSLKPEHPIASDGEEA